MKCCMYRFHQATKTISLSLTVIVQHPQVILSINGIVLWHLPLLMMVWAGGLPWFKASTHWHWWDWTFCLHPVILFYFIPTMPLTYNTILATSTDVTWIQPGKPACHFLFHHHPVSFFSSPLCSLLQFPSSCSMFLTYIIPGSSTDHDVTIHSSI